MTQLFRNKDVDRSALQNQTIAVLGYGSQGRAHALNLHESGYKIVVGLREGKSWDQAQKDGLTCFSVGEATAQADLVAFLTPDMVQAELYETYVKPNLKPDATLLFAHGFNVHYGMIKPEKNHNVILVAPKGPGGLVRRQYQEGKGVPCLVAVHQNASGFALDEALAYAQGLGATHAGVLQTTFAEETETDLFGEQAVLCGGVTELVKVGYETLVEAGYQPEVAYFECLHELKLIVDLIYEGGFAKMHQFVSDTAKYGDLTRGPRVVNPAVREEMKKILTEIQDGTFANEWQAEYERGMPNYKAMQSDDLGHSIEQIGRTLRARMSWLQPKLEAAP